MITAGLSLSENINQMITLSVIALSGFHYTKIQVNYDFKGAGATFDLTFFDNSKVINFDD
jgi:hypothetical protein